MQRKSDNQLRNEFIQRKSDDFQIENIKQEQLNNKQENQHNKHHRDQRRTKFNKNIYELNKTISTEQPQWLPEQTVSI